VPVNDFDPELSVYAYERQKVSDLIAGKDASVKYITGMPGWEEDGNETLTAVRERAYFLPMVDRTLETFVGLVFSKAPTRTFPEGMELFTEDVTGTGQEIDRFAEARLDDVFRTGLTGILVDYPKAPEGITRGEAERQGFKPVLRAYNGNTILAARLRKVRGVMKLVHVRLLEEYTVDGTETDEFAIETKTQIRVLDLGGVSGPQLGVYRQRVFRAINGVWEVDEEIVPQMAFQPIREIPMFFANTRDTEPRAEKPPLAGLAEINIAHLNNSAHYEWSLAWIGSPTAFGKMLNLPEGSTLKIGSATAILSEDAAGDFKIVQASADSVGALKTAMDDKRRDAAALGARMLAEEAKAVEAAETARIHRAGESAVVEAAANATSQCITNALRFQATWGGISTVKKAEREGEQDQELLYWLNTKLVSSKLTPDEIRALLDAWLKGALSKQQLFERLQEGEVVNPELTFENHEEQLAEEAEETLEELEQMAALGLAASGQPPGQPPAQEPPADE